MLDFNPNVHNVKEIRWALMRIRDILHDDVGLLAMLAPDASGVTYTPTAPAHWTGGLDPGDVDDALDQLGKHPVGEFRMVFFADANPSAIL